MIQNRVFISYQHRDRRHSAVLAQEMQFRGIVPWVDKLPGGFTAGDDSEEEARRVIREKASAFVLLLSRETWESTFIRSIEIPEALTRRKREPDFPILVASYEYDFREIAQLMPKYFHTDLTKFHGYSRNRPNESRGRFWARVANEVLKQHVASQTPSSREQIEISVNSYEPLAGSAEELLHIDAYHALAGKVDRPATWRRFIAGVEDAKIAIANRYQRPAIKVNGSKHFTAAFVTGRAFSRFPLIIRQASNEWWSTNGELETFGNFVFRYAPGPHGVKTLIVEIATGEKDIAAGVDKLIESGALDNGGRLQVHPAAGRINITETISRSLAHQVYSEIDRAANTKETAEIHLFIAAPQAFLMTLASLFQGMPDTHVYEWDGRGYKKSAVVPSRVR